MMLNRKISCLVIIVLLLLSSAALLGGCARPKDNVLLTPRQAVYENQPPDVSSEVQKQLTVVRVDYFDERGVSRTGQIVVHKELADDVELVFELIHAVKFPVASVLPIAHPEIQKKGLYGISPDTRNSSGYVWRPGVGSGKLSMHALGMAVDINPHLNPYIKGDIVLPPDASYHKEVPGTLTSDCPVVLLFKKLGWTWGGDWKEKGKVDYMHFEKVPPGWKKWVKKMRTGR